MLKAKGKKKQPSSAVAVASKKGPQKKQPVKPKGFSDDNASWLKPARESKPTDSGDDSLSDGDIMDDEFDPSAGLGGSGQLGEPSSDDGMSGDELGADEEVRPAEHALAVPQRIRCEYVA